MSLPVAVWYDPTTRSIKTALSWDEITSLTWTPLTGASATEIEALYHAVAPLYAAIQQRAGALASLPWRLVNLADDPVRDFDTDACADLLVALEVDYLLHGAAYALRDPTVPLGLRRLHPRTIAPIIDRRQGITGFVRSLGDGETQTLPIDVVAYVWEPNAAAEAGPGVAAAQRALIHAQHVLAESQYVTMYYQRGAVRPTVWTVQGPISPAEADRFQTWLRSLLSGIRNAFRQIALTQKVEAITLGDKLSDVLTPGANQAAVEAILTALHVPHSLVIPSAANYATAERDYQNFILMTILPQARRYAAALTRQHFARQRLRLEVNEAQVEAVQQAELTKAKALAELVNAGVITNDEARERLELEPLIDTTVDRRLTALRRKLDIARLATTVGVALSDALRLAELPSLAAPDAPVDAPATDQRMAILSRLIPDAASALATLRDTGVVDPAAAALLALDGLVELDATGQWRISVPGRQVVDAAARGDVGRAREALSRARDAAARAQRQPAAANALRSSIARPFDEQPESWHETAAIKSPEKLTEHERRIYQALLAAFRRYNEDLAALAAEERWDELARRWSDEVGGALRATLPSAVLDAIASSAQQIGIDTDPAEINRLALQWTMQRSQYLVDGLMWPTTRRAVEAIVANWRATPGADHAALVKALAPVVGAQRAETVAITTATEAATAGAVAYRSYLRDAYALNYILVWETANDERVCPICSALHRKDETAWNGLPGPPAHPRCRCGTSFRRVE